MTLFVAEGAEIVDIELYPTRRSFRRLFPPTEVRILSNYRCEMEEKV